MKDARVDLRGGRPVMGVPTAIRSGEFYLVVDTRFRLAESDVDGDLACSGARGPLAALLFGGAGLPAAAKLSALSASIDAFSLINDDHAELGCAELLRDGLIFDIAGLAGGEALASPEAVHRVALPPQLSLAGREAAWFMVGPHLAGAENLSPVLRVAAGILRHLTGLDGVEAIVWRPARIVMSPAWFVEAVDLWLAGGPFPALARTPDSLRSEGLAFLIGQEFTLWAREGGPSREDSRAAVRLTDWLFAHGRIDTAREAVLLGVGAVWLEPDGPNRLNARLH